jgi:NADH-quinone oxidoreductase subunit J
MAGTVSETIYALSFYSLAVMCVVAALVVISARNYVVSALWLVVCFVGVAGIYVLLKAPFLAMVQILVYAGAIMVLFVMLVMLMDTGKLEPGARLQGVIRSLAAVAGAVIMLALITLSSSMARSKTEWSPWPVVEPGTTERIGADLFTRYALPFEALTLLLLAAVVSALYLARRQEGGE